MVSYNALNTTVVCSSVCFNRTFMELKYKITKRRTGSSNTVLIVPLWN